MSTGECKRCQVLQDERWDGTELSEVDSAFLKEHLGQCSPCAAYVEEMSMMLGAAGQMKDLRYERDVTVAPLILNPRPIRRLGAWALGSAAATATLAIGFFLGGLPERSAQPTLVGSNEMVVRLVVPVPKAQRVEVVGDFTGWQNRIPLEASHEGLWVGEVRLKPGRYQYVIMVDGERMEPDPAARQVVDDGFGGKNSVLDVGSI